MPDIFDAINSQQVASYWQELEQDRVPYLGESLFPAKKQVGLDLSWIKGAKGLPVQLRPSAFDARPTLRDRGSINLQQAQMPFFREALVLSERDRQQLLGLKNANDALLEASVSRVFEDASALIEGALVIPEIMRFSLMQNGQFAIASDKEQVNYTYNYDPAGTWAGTNKVVLSGAQLWSASTATKLADILAIKQAARATGVALTRAVISPTLWANLLSDPAIGHDIYPNSTQAYVGENDLVQYLLNKTGITFSVYEKQYQDGSGNTQSFMDANKIVFLPEGTVGATYFGTTPEEADLMAGYTGAQVSVVDTGVAVTTKVSSDAPVTHTTWVSEIVLPSFEAMSSVFVLQPLA